MAYLVVGGEDILQEERQDCATIVMHNLLHLYVDRTTLGGICLDMPLQK